MVVNNRTKIQALDTLNHRLDLSWVSGDLEGFMDGFTDDVIWMPPDQAAVMGKQACAEWVLKNNARLFGESKEKVYESFTIDLEEIALFGDTGFLRQAITMVMPTNEDGNNPTYRIKGLEVLQKQMDGEWKVARYIWNGYPLE